MIWFTIISLALAAAKLGYDISSKGGTENAFGFSTKAVKPNANPTELAFANLQINNALAQSAALTNAQTDQANAAYTSAQSQTSIIKYIVIALLLVAGFKILKHLKFI